MSNVSLRRFEKIIVHAGRKTRVGFAAQGVRRTRGDRRALEATIGFEGPYIPGEGIAIHFRHIAVPSEGVTAPAFIQGVDYSDQLWFWSFGYPAVMVTDTSFMRNPHYHQPTDTPDTLDYLRMAAVAKGLASTIVDLISAP